MMSETRAERPRQACQQPAGLPAGSRSAMRAERPPAVQPLNSGRRQCNLAWMIHKRLIPSPPRPAAGDDTECAAPPEALAEAAARYWWRRAAAQGSGEGALRLADSEYARGNMTMARLLYEKVSAVPVSGCSPSCPAAVREGDGHEGERGACAARDSPEGERGAGKGDSDGLLVTYSRGARRAALRRERKGVRAGPLGCAGRAGP